MNIDLIYNYFMEKNHGQKLGVVQKDSINKYYDFSHFIREYEKLYYKLDDLIINIINQEDNNKLNMNVLINNVSDFLTVITNIDVFMYALNKQEDFYDIFNKIENRDKYKTFMIYFLFYDLFRKNEDDLTNIDFNSLLLQLINKIQSANLKVIKKIKKYNSKDYEKQLTMYINYKLIPYKKKQFLI